MKIDISNRTSLWALMNSKNKIVFLKLLPMVRVFHPTAISATQNKEICKLRYDCKVDERHGLQDSSDNLIRGLYANSVILALLTRPFLPIINRNIPAKPKITSVVTLKSCGFFYVCCLIEWV